MDKDERTASVADEDRREFLKSFGKFASITPPALAVLMSTATGAHAHHSHEGGGGDGDSKKHSNKGPDTHSGPGH
jgi:hypothetical protein